MTVRKAVFPVAGLGTRFLPVTKANPKEMLPIVDKPLIQYAVEEAIAAGIRELIFVTSHSKRAIEDHFDSNPELEAKLEERSQYKLLSMIRNIIPDDAVCVYIRQTKPLGLGHAVLCARDIIGNEPFAVLLADDLISEANGGCLKNMLQLYRQNQSSVIAVQPIAPDQTKKYGVVAFDQPAEPCGITKIVEKPEPEDAPSNFGVVGRYILTSRIFTLLSATQVGASNEIQLTDAISALLREQPVYAYPLQGERYDCGNKLGYLQATIAYALKDPDIGEEFSAYLSSSLTQKADVV